MTAPAFVVIGDTTGITEYLSGGQDICFGKLFAKTAPECINCRAPVLIEGKIALCKDACAMHTLGASTVSLNKLSSQAVLERLEKGLGLPVIFREILGNAPPGVAAAAARQLLVDRLLYLKTIGFDHFPVPKTKDLLNADNNGHP
jgi:hypothetical protein